MEKLSTNQIRERFLKFFEDRGHYILSSASLLPEDKTVLFITAGMQPLVPHLLGELHPQGKRLASSQKCLRTDDILEVGDNRHLTFFEMLGNWSLGDYFKKESIFWSFELLTDKEHGFGIDPKKLYVTVFEGDNNAPQDEESIQLWQKAFESVGVKASLSDRIYAYPKEKNWWGPVGGSGPCGPDTEIFYDTGKEHNKEFGEKCHVNCDCGRYIEIWNNVFMEYEKTKEGKYIPLKQKNVDTGMGLERIVMILQEKPTVFETDLLMPIIKECEKQSSIPYETQKHSYRIISDHIRASAFLISDGILPSNSEQGYILRRLLRRAIRHAKMLNMKADFYVPLIRKTAQIYKDMYPELIRKLNNIITIIDQEEEKFTKALLRGLKYLYNIHRKYKKEKKQMTSEEIGELAFYMYESYGFPFDDTIDEVTNYGWQFDKHLVRKIANDKFKKHQEISRAGAEKKFGGHGLLLQTGELKAADEEELKKVTKLHTATHLLHQALRTVLGKHIKQMGSDITAERLRFDFAHPEKMTDEEKKKVEDLVNKEIEKELPVIIKEMPYEEATRKEALAFFKGKYGDTVKVYSIGSFSKELCGGPHVHNTRGLGEFKILKESSSSAGVRRIKANLL
jgi:alanyl-tRNA synthetase